MSIFGKPSREYSGKYCSLCGAQTYVKSKRKRYDTQTGKHIGTTLGIGCPNYSREADHDWKEKIINEV